jgi:N utilization substance protein A
VEELLEKDDAELLAIEGLTPKDVAHLRSVIEENVELVEDEQREFICPECNGLVQVGVTICPHCGVGLSFEYDEE